MSDAATANWMKRSIFLTSFFSTQFRGSNPFTSAANRVECREASKSVMGAAPDCAGQKSLPGGGRVESDGQTRVQRL